MSDQSTEQEIQAKGLNAPRVTPSDIEAEIRSAHFFIASDALQGERCVHEFPANDGWLLGFRLRDALAEIEASA